MKNLNKILLLSILLFSCKKETIEPSQPAPVTKQVEVRYGVYLWFDTISTGEQRLYVQNLERGTDFIYKVDLLDHRHILVNDKDTIEIADNIQTDYHFCVWVYVNGKIKYKSESKHHSIHLTI